MDEIILLDKVDSNYKGEEPIYVEEKSKTHKYLFHYTNFQAMSSIIENMTLRASSLTYKQLNDKEEGKRSVATFCNSVFVTCFSNKQEEDMYFWNEYGGNDKKEKVAFCFRNFTKEAYNFINMEYALTEKNKKIVFNKEEYKKIVNAKNQSTDFYKDARIENIKIFDMKYGQQDISNNLQTEGYLNEKKIKISNAIEYGKNKDSKWQGEQETRIKYTLSPVNTKHMEYIDIKIFKEIFKNSIIILNPWAEERLKEKVEEVVETYLKECNVKVCYSKLK